MPSLTFASDGPGAITDHKTIATYAVRPLSGSSVLGSRVPRMRCGVTCVEPFQGFSIADLRRAISDLSFSGTHVDSEKNAVGRTEKPQPRRGVTPVTPGEETAAPAKDSQPGVPKTHKKGPS